MTSSQTFGHLQEYRHIKEHLIKSFMHSIVHGVIRGSLNLSILAMEHSSLITSLSKLQP